MTTLKIGDTAPVFNCLDEKGNSISLDNYKGKKLVLFFYPKASTPGCTVEACNLSDNYRNAIRPLGTPSDRKALRSNRHHSQ